MAAALDWSRCERVVRSAFALLLRYLLPAPDMTSAKPRLLAQVKGRMRARHLSPRTESAYVGWMTHISEYHGTRHPAELGEAEIVAYLTYVATERRVSRSTQMQALSAIQLLYREVLGRPVSDLRHVLRSTSPTRFPTVLSRAGWVFGVRRTGWAVVRRYCGVSCGVSRARGRILCR